MPYFLYFLRLQDGRIYMGPTANLDQRYKDHLNKHAAFTTTVFGADELIYIETHPIRVTAEKRERQLKRWSQAKKLALADGDLAKLKAISKRKRAIP